MRARLTHGSNHCTSTNFAPARYAASATARVSGSLPGSQLTETTWSGWTLAPTRTARSASLAIVSLVTPARLPGAVLPRPADRRLDPVGPRLAVAGEDRLRARLGQALERREGLGDVRRRRAGDD